MNIHQLFWGSPGYKVFDPYPNCDSICLSDQENCRVWLIGFVTFFCWFNHQTLGFTNNKAVSTRAAMLPQGCLSHYKNQLLGILVLPFFTFDFSKLKIWRRPKNHCSDIYHQILTIIILTHYRRKFRSQTSDNMDRWKAEQGRGREKRKIRREKSRRERFRRKKMQMRKKVGKSRNTVFFQWFVAPGDRKVGSLKRRVQSQLARWEMKNCTPLWREPHFEAKMYKTHHCRTTFGSWDVEKVHAVVARSTFRSEMYKTPRSRHFWRFRCRKSARRCGAKHISKSKC